jgi:hypothetical protein
LQWPLAAQPAEKSAHQQFHIETIGLRAPVLAPHRDADRGDELCLGLRTPAAPLTGPLPGGLRSEIGAGRPEGVGDCLHGMPSPASEGDRKSRFFLAAPIQSVAQHLVL